MAALLSCTHCQIGMTAAAIGMTGSGWQQEQPKHESVWTVVSMSDDDEEEEESKSSAKKSTKAAKTLDAKEEEFLNKLELSEEKKELYRKFRAESDKRAATFPKRVARVTPELQEKSRKFQEWRTGELKKIFTEEQLEQYNAFLQQNPSTPGKSKLRGAPQKPKKFKPAAPNSGQTDEDVFAKMDLSQEQKEKIEKLLAEREKAFEKMRAASPGPEQMEIGSQASDAWRAGLKKILTKEQYEEYSSAWQKPERMR